MAHKRKIQETTHGDFQTLDYCAELHRNLDILRTSNSFMSSFKDVDVMKRPKPHCDIAHGSGFFLLHDDMKGKIHRTVVKPVLVHGAET